MNSKEKSKWLTWEVFGVGLTSFFSDLSHEVVTTILPLFLASLGAPPYAVGLIEGISDGLSSFAKLLGGWISDQLGKRKSLALLGYILTGLTQGLFAFAVVWPLALLFRAIGWFGRGWRTPIRDALFYEAVGREASGRAFGFERAMDTVGAVIAPLVALFFISKIGFRNLFLLTWIPGILAFVCFFLFVRDRQVKVFKAFSLRDGLRSFSPQYKQFLFAVTFFGLADFSHTLLIYWAGILLMPVYGLAKASSVAISLYVIHNIVYAAASYPMGHLADKIGKSRILALGYAAACVMFLGLMFSKGNVVVLGFIFILAGFYVAIEDALERAIAGDLLASEIKGTGYGVLASLNGIGDLCSSFIVGVLLSLGCPIFAFGYCLLLGLAGSSLIFRLSLKTSHK
ncbi:MAG: MFS transporter [Candidatus Omnitrophica bacterium]|nr:MFS transporter [Candidatus Omnitrophota bacterium]